MRASKQPDEDQFQDWGSSDQLGAANEVTPEVVRRATGLVEEGQVYDLSEPLSSSSPRLSRVQSPYSLCLWSNPYIGQTWYREEKGATNGVSFADERVSLDLHTGTHIDALAHAWIGERTYNDNAFEDVLDNWGLKKLGIEHVPPLFCRGILVDLPLYRGRDLRPGEVITPQDIENALARVNLQVRRADIVLIRTGWARYYGIDNDTYAGDCPGIGIAAARWLAKRRVTAVASDTMGLEVQPAEEEHVLHPVHQYLLARAGIYIIEQATFEEIARLNIGEFLCVCAAPKFLGATAAPVRLTAVR